MSKNAKKIEIVKYKLTRKNNNGLYNRADNIKLLAIDTKGKEHYLKFVTQTFANELLENSSKSEVINDLKPGLLEQEIRSAQRWRLNTTEKDNKDTTL